jgi:Holliday junction resolvase
MSTYKAFKELERQITRDLRGLDFKAKRLWDVQFEEGGGIDVVAVREDLELAIQCKYGNKPNLRKAYLEAVSAREKKHIALGICRFKNERDTLVCLSWGDFKRLIRR